MYFEQIYFKDTTLGIEVAPALTNRHAKAQLELFSNIPRPKPVVDGNGGGGSDGGSDAGDGDGGGSAITISLFLIFSTIFTYILV